jgi:hypothetical protein
MWLCMNDAFVSVVASDKDPDILLVRARAFEHLRHIFGETQKIHITPDNDYRYRVFVTRQFFADLMAKRIAGIDYHNFKDSVKEEKLHNLYSDFWFRHMIYQNGKNWWKKQKWNKLEFKK